MTPVVHVSFESVTDEFAFSVTCVEMIQLCGYTNESQLKVMEWMGNIRQYRNHVWIVFILPPRYRRLIVSSGKYEPTTQKKPPKQKTFEKTNKKSVKWMLLYALINLLYCLKKTESNVSFVFEMRKVTRIWKSITLLVYEWSLCCILL